MTPAQVAARVAAASANEAVLAWLGAHTDRAVFWRDRTDQGWDQAGQVLCDDLGRLLPDAAKLCVGIHNLLVHPQTGRIVGASHGRFTFLLRTPGPQRTETLDGPIDLTPLGAQWSVADLEEHTAEVVYALYVSQAASRLGRGDR